MPLILIDHDRVEPHNLRRQNFFAGDVGQFKSQVLAERLSRLYGRKIGYSNYPYDPELALQYYGRNAYRPIMQGLIIGCVDGWRGRDAISHTRASGSWWLDAGNGEYSGQVHFGNAWEKGMLSGAFNEEEGTVSVLPMPHLQEPALLVPPSTVMPVGPDCAEAVEREEQSPVINQQMATLVLTFVHQFLTGKLTWMAAYVDIEAGTMQTVAADPVVVARKLSVKVDGLMFSRKKNRVPFGQALEEVE